MSALPVGRVRIVQSVKIRCPLPGPIGDFFSYGRSGATQDSFPPSTVDGPFDGRHEKFTLVNSCGLQGIATNNEEESFLVR